MICENANGLVPAYLDGELSDEQASPLREHLLGCPACRETAKQETALKRWFREADCGNAEAPEGFAARVARRAFAGDVGSAEAGSLAGGRSVSEPARVPQGTLLPFMLKLTAVAAGVLFVLAIALQRESLPDNSRIGAETVAPWDEEGAPDAIPFDSLPRDPGVDRSTELDSSPSRESQASDAEARDAEER